MVMNSNYVRIFDTTLRDGEQSPGATLTSAEKVEIARGLSRLGVDVIEAGFPAASPDDLEGVRRIAVEVGNSTIGEPNPSRRSPSMPTAPISLTRTAVPERSPGQVRTFLMKVVLPEPKKPEMRMTSQSEFSELLFFVTSDILCLPPKSPSFPL